MNVKEKVEIFKNAIFSSFEENGKKEISIALAGDIIDQIVDMTIENTKRQTAKEILSFFNKRKVCFYDDDELVFKERFLK